MHAYCLLYAGILIGLLSSTENGELPAKSRFILTDYTALYIPQNGALHISYITDRPLCNPTHIQQP
jgi:hypothetical protein